MERLITCITIVLILLSSCRGLDEPAPRQMDIVVSVAPAATKAKDPDEDLIKDINLFIFDGNGDRESHKYLKATRLVNIYGKVKMNASIALGAPYTIVCCANMGKDLSGVTKLDELREKRVSLAYPDGYSEGIPMVGVVEGPWGLDQKEIEVPMERMMAKISISLDRSALDNDVSMIVRSLRIGNCPKSASILGPSKVESGADVFSTGFLRTGSELNALNNNSQSEVDVYMFENMQGDLLSGISEDAEKVLYDSSYLSAVCSYIEMRIEYSSPSRASRPEEYLIYRFYLGESVENFDIERGCHYHFAMRPEDDGLNESSWRVDKSSIYEY